MRNSPHGSHDEGSMECSNVAVIVIDAHHIRWSPQIDDWNTATLLACVSEDPADWSEIAAVWPRYKTGPAAEFADGLPAEVADLDTVLSHLEPDEPWVAIDLPQCRIFSSTDYGNVRRNGRYGIGPDNGFGPAIRMSVHLPPWWEIHNGAQPHEISQPRASQICRPNPRRDVLWGPALANGLAARLVAVYRDEPWSDAGASDDPRARYRFTVGVHRDWLMTPRDDLGGRIPRDCLHGGIEWLDRLVEGQQWNVERGASRIPRSLARYDEAPMGRSEVCMYFDACREMIDAGWQWLIDHDRQTADASAEVVARRLANVLRVVQREWMLAPQESGHPPASVIQDERDRIPQMAGGGEDDHIIDCDCPICQMMAEGAFGPCFIGFDGHYLELDDEFAFSLCATREEWEMQRQEFAEMERAMDVGVQEDGQDERELWNEPAASPAELDAVWKDSYVADDLPGDPLGHLRLSFRLADIIGDLKHRDAPQADIDSLNEAFRGYRHADQEERRSATERFKDVLEEMAQRHEFLIGRAADLQSTLDDLLRRPVPADIDDNTV